MAGAGRKLVLRLPIGDVMTDKKLRSLFCMYLNYFDTVNLGSEVSAPRQLNGDEQCSWCHQIDESPEVRHLKYMCVEGMRLVDDGSVPKAMRWLGFLQGVLWARNAYTLAELRSHSKSAIEERFRG